MHYTSEFLNWLGSLLIAGSHLKKTLESKTAYICYKYVVIEIFGKQVLFY